MSEPSPPGDSASPDLASLVARCLELCDAGEAARADALLELHPEHAAEARRRIGALQSLGLVAADGGTAAQPDAPRRLGPYLLLRQLGAGGMGVVHLARDERVGRLVALKSLPARLGLGGQARERFRREAQAVARLEHPGIVPLYDFGDLDGLPFFAMPLVRGCTLADLLAELRAPGLPAASLDRRDLRRALRAAFARSAGLEEGSGAPVAPSVEPRGSWTELCARLALDVAEALHHVHAAGIVHRDVKPSNVMLTVDLRARLFDFGLARLEGSERMTWTGDLAGTPAYASPEQVRGAGDAADGRSDVYSLGATLYELLTLHLPFEGASTEELLRRIVRDDPPPPRRLNPAVPRDLATICGRALEKDPARRYAGAAEMAEDLRRLLAGEPILAKPVGRVARLARRARRQPARSALVLLLAALAAGIPTGLGVAGARIRRERDLAEQVVELLERLVFEADVREGGAQTPLADALSGWGARIRAELGDQPLVQARLLQRLGAFLDELGCHADGEDLLRAALDLQLRELGEGHADTAATLNHLGNLTRGLGRMDEAEALYRRALAARRGLRSGDAEPLIQSLLNLRGLLRVLDRQGEADALEDEAASLMERAPEVDLQMRVDLLCARGLRIAASGDARAGEALVLQAIEHLQTAGRPYELNIAYAYGVLGSLLRREGRLEESERALRLQLDGCERGLGARHLHTGLAAMYVAEVSALRGDDIAAEGLFERALEVLAREAPDRALDIAGCRSYLGLTKLLLGRHAEAEALLEQACAELEALGEPGLLTLAYTRFQLAVLHARQEPEAPPQALERAFAVLACARPAGTVEHARELLQWVQLAREGGARAVEDELLERVAATAGRLNDVPPWLRGDLAYGYALQARADGDPRSAWELLEASVAAYREPGADPRGALEAVASIALGGSLVDLGRPSDARPVLERALAYHCSRWGERHQLVAETLHELGRCAALEGDLAAAEAAFEASLHARGERARERARAADARERLAECRRLAGCARRASARESGASSARR